jgi:hypothetical protein
MLAAVLALSCLGAPEKPFHSDDWLNASEAELATAQAEHTRSPVAMWPAGVPLPTDAEIEARRGESERRLNARMQRMRSDNDGCGEVSSQLAFFEDIVTLSASPNYEPTRIVYIDASAPLGGDGSSWDTAYQSIQDALSAEPYESDLVEFRIAGGLYRADRVQGVNTLDPELTIELPGLAYDMFDDEELVGVKSLKGGFAGRAFENPDERDLDLYPTVFTGDLLGDDDPQNFANYEDNTKVLFLPNETELNGITIEHARIAVNELRWMTDCTVRYCFASGDDLPLELAERVPVFAREARIVGSTFHNNRGETYGGAMSFRGLTAVANSRFLQNTAPAGGAIGLPFNTNGVLISQNCYFAANIADGELGGVGGAVFLAGGSAQFAHCTFVGNSAIDGGGSGVFGINGVPNFRNCILDQNYAFDGTGDNAEISLGQFTFDSAILEANLFGRFNPGIETTVPPRPRIRLNTGDDPGFVNLLGPDGLLGTLDDNPSLGFDSAAIGQSVSPIDVDYASLDLVQFDTADLDGDCMTMEILPVDMLGNPRAIEGTPGEGVDGYAADAGCIEFVPDPEAQPGQPWTYVDPMITNFSAEPIRLYVDQDAPADGDGLSWSSAFTNLCKALDIASHRVGPVEIWVAAGEYAPTCSDSGWNSFRMLETVTMLGGFVGDETSADQRDWIINETILTGDVLGNDDNTDESTFDDNAPHVLASIGPRGGGTVDGFTIRGGANRQLLFGPGIFWSAYVGLGSSGEALFHGTGELLVRNIRVDAATNNFPAAGFSTAGREGNLLIESSRITGGSSSGANATGVFCFAHAPTGVAFPPVDGTGSLIIAGSEIDLLDVAFIGGAGASSVWSAGPIRIEMCEVTSRGNSPPSFLVQSRSSWPVVIMDSELIGPRVRLRMSDLRTQNSTFNGSIFVLIPFPSQGLQPRFEATNSVFATDQAGLPDFFSPWITVVAGSVFPPDTSSHLLDDLDETNLIFDFESNAAAFFLDPLGPDGLPYTGDEDLRLVPGSPAINTGLNEFVTSEFDLDGNPRIIAHVVDRGAYEFTGTCTGDVNGDGVIDLADLNRVLANYGQDTPFGDADGDGSVTMTDLNIVLAAFGQTCTP